MDKRLEVLETLLSDSTITTIVHHVDLGNQVFLWMSPRENVFPRIVVRELSNSNSQGADDICILKRQLIEIAFTVPAKDVENFVSLCTAIPLAIRRIHGRLIDSGSDTPIPEHGVVSKSQTFEFYSEQEED